MKFLWYPLNGQVHYWPSQEDVPDNCSLLKNFQQEPYFFGHLSLGSVSLILSLVIFHRCLLGLLQQEDLRVE